MAVTPTLLSTSYNGQLAVGAQWQVVPGINQFVITVYAGGSVIASGSGFGTTGTVTLPQPLTDRTCQVAVATNDGSGRGPDSNRLLIVIDLVTGLSASYDGSQVASAWTLPARPVNAAQLTVQTATGGVLAQQTIVASSGTVTPSAPLAAGASLVVRAAIGTSTGPPVSLPLVVARATTRAIIYDPADGLRIKAFLVTPAPAGSVPGATLLADGVPFASADGIGALVSLPLTAPLDPAVAWTLRPVWSAGAASGPPGPAVDVLSTAPILGEVRLDDATATLSWRSLPGPPYPTGAQVLFRASGQTTSAAVISGADSGVCVPAPPLVAGVVYAATVAALRGPTEGPASAAVSAANVRTAITATDYDGQRLSLSWDGADPAGTSGCRVEVLEGSTVVATRAATGGSATLDVALEPGAAHGVRLRWTTPGGLGPAGPTATVLAATATASAIAVTATAVAVTIAPPAAAPSVARYVAHLFQGERRLASSPPVDAGAAPVATIACATAGLTGLSVRVQALVAAPATGSGPLGPVSPVLAVGPTIKRAVVTGTTLELRWTPAVAPDGAVGSTTVVVAPTSGPATPKTFAGLPGQTAALTLDAGYLDPNVGWTVTASAVGPTGASPAGPAVALLAGAPTVGSANWNGDRLRASWAWPPGASGAATATAYRLELFTGTTPRGHVVVDGLAGTLVPDGPIDPGVPVRLAVSPLAPPAAFVATPALSIPWTAPQLTAAVTSLDGHLALSFVPATAAAGAISGYDAVLSSSGRPDTIVALAGTSSPQTIALPPDLGGPFVPQRVSLRATGPQVTGPTSDLLPVLREAPIVRDADFANGELTLAWAPVAEPVGGYEVRVTGGASPVEISVPGSSARLPLTPGASARVTVVARAGGGSSPARSAPTASPGCRCC